MSSNTYLSQILSLANFSGAVLVKHRRICITLCTDVAWKRLKRACTIGPFCSVVYLEDGITRLIIPLIEVYGKKIGGKRELYGF